MVEAEGRILAMKKRLCYSGMVFHESSISKEPLKKVTFKGKEIYIPDDYVTMTYFGKEIIVPFSQYYGYQTHENERRYREGKEVRGIVEPWHDMDNRG